jgi:ATP-dependent helicase/nuclease subunit A
LNLNIFNKQNILKETKSKEKENVDVLKILEENSINKEKLKKIDEILDYSYPSKTSTSIPTKTSVTNIKQMKNEHEISDSAELPKPEFLRNEEQEKITGAQKGTLIHLCMQKLDEKQEYDLQKVKDLIHDLNKKHIITEIEKESINPYKILEFTKSKIWDELKEAKEIYKEKPFYINIPVKEIYEDKNIEENILVQGIIDLYYIDKNENIVLVDYKTDYVQDKEELVKKYFDQLELYKKAIEYAYNKNVSRIYIYSTYLNELIDINL